MSHPARAAAQPRHEHLPAPARRPDIPPVTRPEHQRPGARRAGRAGDRNITARPHIGIDRQRARPYDGQRATHRLGSLLAHRDQTRRGGIPHIQRGRQNPGPHAGSQAATSSKSTAGHRPRIAQEVKPSTGGTHPLARRTREPPPLVQAGQIRPAPPGRCRKPGARPTDRLAGQPGRRQPTRRSGRDPGSRPYARTRSKPGKPDRKHLPTVSLPTICGSHRSVVGSATSTDRRDLRSTIGAQDGDSVWASVRTRGGHRPGPWWARPVFSRVRRGRRGRRAGWCRLRS